MKKPLNLFKNKTFTNIIIIFSFILYSLLSLIMFMHTHQFMGFGDSAFHLKRILELKESFLHGSFLPMFSFNQFHGSEIMSFYPYINLFPAVILLIIIHSKIGVMYGFFILNEFCAFLCGYYGSNSFNKSKKISYIFSVIYGLSTLFLDLGTNDFGEITSLAVFPLIVFGCLRLFQSNKYGELVIGMTLIIYSHVLFAIIAVIFIIFWILMNITKLKLYKILNLLKAIILTGLLTNIIWVPAIILKFTNDVSLYVPAHAFGNINNFFAGQGTRGLINGVLTDTNSGTIDLFAIIGIILSIILYKRISDNLKKMLWISIFFCFLCSSEFPWRIVPYPLVKLLSIFQVTSRFYIIPEILSIYAFSVIIVIFLKNIRYNNLILFGVILIAIFMQFGNQHTLVTMRESTPVLTSKYFIDHSKTYKSRKLLAKRFGTYRLTRSSQFKYPEKLNYTAAKYDYYPKNSIPRYKLINNNYGTVGKKKIKIFHIGFNLFRLHNYHNIAHLNMPLLDFDNSRLKVTINGHVIKHYSDNYGRLSISNVNKGYNIIKVNYMPDIWIVIIKIIMFLLGIAWLIKIDLNNKKDKVI